MTFVTRRQNRAHHDLNRLEGTRLLTRNLSNRDIWHWQLPAFTNVNDLFGEIVSGYDCVAGS